MTRWLVGLVALSVLAGCSNSSSRGGASLAPDPEGSSPAAVGAVLEPADVAPPTPTLENEVVGGPSTGLLQVDLHDAPAATVEKVFVTFDKVTVHAGDQVLVLPGSEGERQVDLLSLQGGVVEHLGLGALPAGTYDQVRLHVVASEVELLGGQAQPLTIPSGGTSGLKIGHGFTIPAGGSVKLTLDWDVGAHLHHNRGQGWILRPTIVVESEEITDPCANITFADPGLEAAVRDAIGKPSGTITGTDVAGLVTLNATQRGIQDLSGIECLTAMTGLNLSGNPLSDLRPLASLTGLQRLLVYQTDVVDLSPLTGLTQITHLYLPWDSQIASLDPLAGMVNMRVFQIVNAPLIGGDISAVANWTQAYNVALVNVGIQDSDMGAFANMSQPWRLWLDANPISDVSALGNLTSLVQLVLRGNEIQDTAPLANLTNLKALSLAGNPLDNTSLGPVGVLTGLESLDLVYVPTITDISALQNLTGLKRLSLWNSPLASLAPLSNMQSMQVLSLRNCTIQDSDLGALAGMSELYELRFSSNPVSDMSVLGSLPKLAVFEMRHAQVSDLSPFQNHPALTRAWFGGNQITPAGAAALASIPTLTFVELGDNPITCTDPTIQALQAGGVDVRCDP